MDATGIRGHAGKIDAAHVLDFVESESTSGPSAFHYRRRPLRKSWPDAQRRLLDFSGRAGGENTGSSVSKHVEVPPAGGCQHADYYGWSGHGHCTVPGIFAGAQSDRSKGQELALLRFAARALQLFLPR